MPPEWNDLGGNSATVSAFDVEERKLYFMAGAADQKTGDVAYDLATLDVDAAAIVAHPRLASVGMPGCTDCVSAITL